MKAVGRSVICLPRPLHFRSGRSAADGMPQQSGAAEWPVRRETCRAERIWSADGGLRRSARALRPWTCGHAGRRRREGPDRQGRSVLVEQNCSRCHAIGKEGNSTHPEAPPFRTLSSRYPIEDLAESLAEGIVSGHPDMPIFVFSPTMSRRSSSICKSIQDQPSPSADTRRAGLSVGGTLRPHQPIACGVDLARRKCSTSQLMNGATRLDQR